MNCDGSGANVSLPGAELAIAIALKAIGRSPTRAHRFTTGARHYVFEVEFEDRPPVVVRIGDQNAHAEMIGAVRLYELLKPRGVPLAAILASDVAAGFPRPLKTMARLRYTGSL
jgi:hypothetical protein